ncbi:M protein repeat protein [Aspergillus homomorphus CBS 101889]|uniref:M protein repeat protein n=1 Tax=Aspergillus homomorphus (strain CBS 101889) TaxID=1450537 RepID=A0A395HVJ6_ASPHC|nr:M protein repeat protein [Aspergillus homomorphus CBS 101889]RAL11415.1 M protein repeat protein [Aspergillus homomorphus CBS 101889]
MAQNSQGNKPKWKVGSFLQQAVAGVESRLDQILAEEEDQKQLQAKSTATKSKSTEQPGSMVHSVHLSRSSSNARKNDRLQERLARAMVKNSPGSLATQGSSRNSSPVTSPNPSNGARSSMDIDSNLGSPSLNAGRHSRSSSQVDGSTADGNESRNSHDSGDPRASNDMNRLSTETALPQQTSSENESDAVQDSTPGAAKPPVDEPDSSAPATLPRSTEPAEASSDTFNSQEKSVAQLQAEHKAAESHWQEEMYGYIERIDALQSKLKYLAKEAAESAKKAAATAEPGSMERQLREKDEKIALLLEEGQKLSKSEMDHRTAIKKLRQQLAENAKSQNETKKKTEKMERDLADAETRAKRAEAAEKRAYDSLSAQSKASRDLESVTAERNALSQTVQEMKGQLARAVARAEAAEAKAQSEALELEKRRATQLEEDLSSAKIEREISEGKLRREISDLQATIEQEKERARMLEVELKGEQSMLESKMESLRFRAEEASSGVAGDTQVKLLRQIETLQTQYAVASENWQTLEGSLLARLANVEKERDEATRRDGDMRRKIRETNLKVKRIEEEFETAKETEHDLESKLEAAAEENQKLEQKLKKATDDLDQAQKEFTEQQKVIDATWAQKLEDERAKLREHASPPPAFLQQPRTQSPVAYSRRPSALEPIGTLSDYRPTSRRPSTLPTSPDTGNLSRQNSFPLSTQSILSPSTATSSTHLPIPETPSINFEPDELFSRSATPSAYGGAPTQHSRGINDIISESTVGAGPSVQLVERMSATVRRLESERAASKDELSRITAQRDEARQQVVDLMREVETKRASDTRVQELEQRLDELDQRYETTLEMLGEKSEQVEELEADIADLKKIYRELVDSTMK